ncbi:MAG: methyltransferase domain-containing protein [Methanobacterium sp.]|nr:methyltransferase domain-containing protein [Methanobacterium sp.]
MLNEFRLKMLNREASSPKNKAKKIIKHLNIQKGHVIGDIGSGGGFFTQEFSREVGSEGQVQAIDIHQNSLDFMGNNLQNEGIQNVQPILAKSEGIKLPENSVDLFFLRNVFHHISNQVEYLQNLKSPLKQDGRIAVIDYNKRKLSLTGLFGHYTSDISLLDRMNQAGFSLLEKHDFLPDQLFMIFEKKP